MDVRGMFDREYIGAWDLVDKAGKPCDFTVTISKVQAGTLVNKGKSNKKPIVFFEGAQKGFALNKTNMKVIASMYGYKVEDWKGKRITLYSTTTQFGSDTVECIRCRPGIPKGKDTDLTREPGEEG